MLDAALFVSTPTEGLVQGARCMSLRDGRAPLCAHVCVCVYERVRVRVYGRGNALTNRR